MNKDEGEGGVIQIGKFRRTLYVSAVLIIIIPIVIVLMSDVTFSPTLSHTMISTSIVLLLLGKMITVFEKKSKNKSYALDVGALIGLVIVLIINLFK
ncbi:MAG TPA: histidine kinase [Virgibacillus sp.]|nr:histidine kinase [Virgibacillus sp.]